MSELQTAITNLQLKHSELVAAVKSYPGTVASAANAALGEAPVEQRKIRDTVRSLRDQIENDGQSLILDWEHDVAVVNGEGRPINEVVEFSRSTGGGRFGPDGEYEWVPAGAPRIDYDPETGECKGLLVEEQRTNLLTWSNDFTQFIANRLTAEPNMITDSVSPSPVLMRCYRSRVLAEGETNTCTIEAKAGTRHGIFLEAGDGGTSHRVKVNLLTGEFTYVNSAVEATILPAGEGWWRIIITRPQPEPYNTAYLAFCFGFCDVSGTAVLTEGDGTGTIYVRRSQVEVGTFPTSYIPTEGSAVTRAADIVLLEDGFSWWNPAEGTIAMSAEFVAPHEKTTILLQVTQYGSNSTADRLAIIADRTRALGHNQPGPTVNISTLTPGEPTTLAVAYAGGAADFYTQGAHSRSTGGTPTRNYGRMWIMSRHDGLSITCHLKRLEYYPRALPDTELQELTSL